MKKNVLLLMLCCILPTAIIAQKSPQSICRDKNGDYYVTEKGINYKIDTTVITIKVADTNIIKSIYPFAKINKLGYVYIPIPQGNMFSQFVEQLNNNNDVNNILYSTYGTYNTITPNDPLFMGQWYLSVINVYQAWQYTMGNENIIVAVLDSGVDWGNEDIGAGLDSYQNIHLNQQENDWTNPNDPTSGDGLDNDLNGLIDDWKGYNFATHSNDCRTSVFHGTLVAGIIAAKTNNSIGIAGVAGGNNCHGVSILPYCVGINAPTTAALVEGIINAVDNGAKIIQLSLTIPYSDDVEASLSYAYENNVTIICASGNRGNVVEYPAVSQHVISVGAIDQNMQRAVFSNYGEDLDIVAPGTNIPDPYSSAYYNSGTSFAAPQVSAVAALMLSVNPKLSNHQISAILKKTAKKLDGYSFTYSNLHPYGKWNIHVGYGLLDAGAAVQMAYDLRNVGDLYVKDNLEDTGAEPNTTTSVYTNAPEIRIVKDGQEVTTIKAGETYEVRITVRNCDSRSTPAGKKVRLNWSRVSNSMPWNSAWRSLPQYPWNPWSSVRGGYIGQCELPLIYAGGFYEASVTWTVPTLNDIVAYPFGDFNWSCALLARIEDGYVTEGENFTNYDITSFVANNNNVARKNITILQENHEPLVAALEYVRDIDGSFPIRLQYKSKPNSLGQHLSEVAEIHLQFDENLTQIWEQSGSVPEGCSYKGNGLFIIKDTVVNFDGLAVDTSKTYFFSAYAKFHEALPAEESVMSFDINQFVLAKDDTIFGGNINFTAVYDEDAYMQVVAYEDKSALAGDGIQFTAASAASDAEYVWFNMVGDTIGIGDELNVTASTTQRYYLVGRSELDESIGYDSVTVTVRLAAITALTPNPANNQTVVGYRLATNVTSATVVITNATGQVLYSAPLDVTQTTHIVNLQAIPTGQYSVRIESQGSPLDSKTLIVY